MCRKTRPTYRLALPLCVLLTIGVAGLAALPPIYAAQRTAVTPAVHALGDEGTVECWVRLAFEPEILWQRRSGTRITGGSRIPEGVGGTVQNGVLQVRAATILTLSDKVHSSLGLEWVALQDMQAPLKPYNGPWALIDRGSGATQILPPLGTCVTATKDKWHHIALVWRGIHVELYFDGSVIAAHTLGAPWTGKTAAMREMSLTLGPGLISVDEVRISRVAHKPGELGYFSAKPLESDKTAVILEDFDKAAVVDGKIRTATGFTASEGCSLVDGKWGKAIALWSLAADQPPAERSHEGGQ